MKTVRKCTFETNSSSCHCVTTIPQDELKKFAENRLHYCIYLPDTGDYCNGDKYQIMSLEDARKQYNRDYEELNKKYPNSYEKLYQDTEDVHKNDDDWQDFFEDDLENGLLSSTLGMYLSFDMFMSYIVIENDLKFDVTWWNNC